MKYEFAPAQTRRQRVLMYSCVGLLGVAAATVCGGVAFALSPYETLYRLQALTGEPIVSETEMPDGSIYYSKLEAVPGHKGRFRLLGRSKVDPRTMPASNLEVFNAAPKRVN